MIESLDRQPWPVCIRVEPSMVEQFRRAVGSSTEDRVPPTFHVTLEHLGPRIVEMLEAKGVDSTRMLHGEEEIEFPHGQLQIGDVLEGELAIVDVGHRQGSLGPLTLITVAGHLTTGDGKRSVKLRRTLVLIKGDVPSSTNLETPPPS